MDGLFPAYVCPLDVLVAAVGLEIDNVLLDSFIYIGKVFQSRFVLVVLVDYLLPPNCFCFEFQLLPVPLAAVLPKMEF